MTALQIILIIFAVLFLLILALLMLPIRLFLSVGKEKAVFSVKLWLFRVYSTDAPKKKKKAKKGTEKKPKKEKKKRSFSETLELIEKLLDALKKASPGLKLLFSKFKINKLKLHALCAGDDAADTAMQYGIMCSALYGVSGYLKTLDRFSKTTTDLNVECDFTSESSSFDFELVCSIKVLWATKSLLKIIFATMNTITEVMNNDRQ